MATNFLFHGQIGAAAYNGKINAVSGPNMDQITTIISGLPVSDHDHGINGIEFGDHGELYIQIGGNVSGFRFALRHRLKGMYQTYVLSMLTFLLPDQRWSAWRVIIDRLTG